MKTIFKVDLARHTAAFDVVAVNQFGKTKQFEIAYYVPDIELLRQLAAIECGTELDVEAVQSEKGAPCAMTMTGFRRVPAL